MSHQKDMYHIRSAFRQGGFNEALIKELRKEALKVLTPAVIAKVPPPYFSEEEETAYAAKYSAFSDEERAAYKAPPSEYRAFSAAHHAAYAAIGKSLEWNLTIDGDIGATGDYAFFFTATASDSVLTPSQQSAAALLYATLEALEKEALSDRVQQNILDAIGGLDFDAVNMGNDYSKEQSIKAGKPRGKITDDGETIKDIINRLAQDKNSLGEYTPAPDLWSHLWDALDKVGANPVDNRDNSKPRKSFYSYTLDNGETKTISRGRFETLVGNCRN